MATSQFLLCLILLSSTQFFSVYSHEFEVGDNKGWAVPSSKNDDFYNDWASKQRFLVNDSIDFKYNKDSVMVVTADEYVKCHSSHPIFFSNTGNTTYRFDHPGLFYFISGVSGHCAKGQRLIIKVLESHISPPPASQNGTGGSSAGSNGAVNVAAPFAAPLVMSALVAFLIRFF
ncbi:mavicyanin-like [Macadamia integrifolia]|uniref:mavicyanin-like n=1 Tax=Macadamia integrifolia TaxID=60698 RepID=UPI001C5019AF|nr:mavicyanin-like [Macadamia integrifolia]XP_042495972.1 mavicyanin-like [Macadamia integrifolia]